MILPYWADYTNLGYKNDITCYVYIYFHITKRYELVSQFILPFYIVAFTFFDILPFDILLTV